MSAATRTTIVGDHAAEDIRRHLAAVVASSTFASSPRLRQFLIFIVEAALQGDHDTLKEYVIATEVYGRDITYDPQIDSTVRVEASRLRRRLHDYYASEGSECALEIEIPKGRYVPLFRARAARIQQEEAARPLAAHTHVTGRRVAWLALSAAMLAGAVLWQSAPRVQAASPSAVRHPVSPEILAKYLLAQRLLRSPVLQEGWPGKVPPTVTESIRAFQQVTVADPGFARAWVGLAEAEEWAYELNGNQPAARLDRAMAALDRAVRADPSSADAWSRLSSLYFHRFDNKALAEAAARKAVELNPKDLAATARLIDLLRIRGNASEAARVLQQALMMEPAAPRLWFQRALLAYDSARYEEALGFADHALGLFTGKSHPMGWWIKGLCLERMGRLQEAEKHYRAGMGAGRLELWNSPSLGHLLARAGRTREAHAILDDLIRRSAKGMVVHYQIALVLTGLGRTDEAVASLERGRAAGDTSIAYVGLEQRFHPLRDHPGFRLLL